ncbi:MAG TPA: antibiotic biosynthesis monooxygenase [Acidobacteriota bacterium]|nr:antibiotic biosynthesis monooxygenase [Acidobacteriota bacterium]
MMIYQLRLIPQQDKRQTILQIFRSIIPATLAKPGCMDSSLFEEFDASRSILYTEQWSSDEDLHRHVRSSQFLKILAAMDMAESPPQVNFHEVVSTSHLELIQEIRDRNQPVN